MEAVKIDNLHFDFTEVDGYQKPFTAVISEREAGKSTATWRKIFKKWQQTGQPTLVIRRRIADISTIYIDDIEELLNKFGAGVQFTYKKGDIKQGAVDVLIDGKLFFRVLGLSNPMSRIKSLMIRGLAFIVFDEFICNGKMGEKYLKDEAFIFSEVYNTFARENPDVKCIFLGNPYSLYNPYFVWWGVDTIKLKPGTIQAGQDWVVQAYKIKPELKEAILARNPLYRMSEDYKRYAFDGEAVNDANIRVLPKCPDNYHLSSVFRFGGKYLGIFENNKYTETEWFWVGIIDYSGERRKIYAFDFNDLINGTILFSRAEKNLWYRLKDAIRFRYVQYKSVEESYMLEEIYVNL